MRKTETTTERDYAKHPVYYAQPPEKLPAWMDDRVRAKCAETCDPASSSCGRDSTCNPGNCNVMRKAAMEVGHEVP
jgi:hypothetical protein